MSKLFRGGGGEEKGFSGLFEPLLDGGGSMATFGKLIIFSVSSNLAPLSLSFFIYSLVLWPALPLTV